MNIKSRVVGAHVTPMDDTHLSETSKLSLMRGFSGANNLKTDITTWIDANIPSLADITGSSLGTKTTDIKNVTDTILSDIFDPANSYLQAFLVEVFKRMLGESLDT